MKVYFDNAATTPLDPRVLEEMTGIMASQFGNPSSIHSHGRLARSLVEKSRKKVAELIGASPSEIFFTSGGTEADNTILNGCVNTLGVEHIIISRIEHHAVLHTAEELEKSGRIKVSFIDLNGDGTLKLDHLEELLALKSGETLVSLMHANNEIGNLADLMAIGSMAHENGALFHSDTVQSMGHLPHDLATLPVDFIVGSAHKFNGPKGIGFMYINHEVKINPFIQGGGQERNMRGGTENVYGIAGLAKALELAYAEMEEDKKHIEGLKIRMVNQIKSIIPDVQFNGLSAELNKSLYTVLSVSFPPANHNEMLLFNLDIAGISASGGSACASGSNIGSHVLAELDQDQNRGTVRFSFSKFNTPEEVDFVVEKVGELYGTKMKQE